jgi:hypothetical protein
VPRLPNGKGTLTLCNSARSNWRFEEERLKSSGLSNYHVGRQASKKPFLTYHLVTLAQAGAVRSVAQFFLFSDLLLIQNQNSKI